MHERYSNRKLYFDEQAQTTRRFVIPYINDIKKITPQNRILEIGCGEGGNLLPFAELGCNCTGIDLNEGQIEMAKTLFAEIPAIRQPPPRFICKNIYNATKEDIGEFDIIMMRDVIEHIPEQEKLLVFIKQFLKNDGVIFFGFPPWQMPFGGHQQISHVKWISRAPYLHLLPMRLYKYILKKAGEHDTSEFENIKNTGISMERFERAVKQAGYRFEKKTPYFINPNYEVKFHLKTRKKIPVLGDIPYIRNFVTTCLYAVIRHNES